jgi:hypothetical protein
MSDRILLTFPTDERLQSVATLLLGGVGTRHQLPYERTDDLQLAVLSVLDAAAGDEVSLEIDAGDGDVRLSLGPLRPGTRDDAAVARVLTRLVDSIDYETRAGDEWVNLRMASASAPAQA